MNHRRSAVAFRYVAFEDLGLFSSVLDREGWDAEAKWVAMQTGKRRFPSGQPGLKLRV
jgi:hypothetical protein